MSDSKISRCGLDCAACEEYSKCGGCNAKLGVVWWTEFAEMDKCPIYGCCADRKGFDHCGQCDELPCGLFTSVKDPRMTDEEHAAGIRDCVERLRKLS